MIFEAQAEAEMTAFLSGSDVANGPPYESQHTIAIVDDERDIVDIYSRVCEQKGFRIIFTAYDGADALGLFENTVCPDVILMDHRMPNMTGLEAMERMLAIDPGAKFIFLSADDEVQELALGAGAKAFLKKPARLGDILDAIAKVLDRRK